MTSILLGLSGIAMLGVCAVAARLWFRVGAIALLVTAIGLCLAYDALVLAAGRWVGTGDALEALSVPRFWLTAIAVPLLIIVAGILAARLGVQQARTRNLALGGAALAAMLILLGVIEDGVRLDLVPENSAGTVHYVNSGATGLPLPLVITALAMVILGMATWRYANFPWLFLGGAAMFIGSAFGRAAPWAGAVGELLLMCAVVYAMVVVADRDSAPTAEATR